MNGVNLFVLVVILKESIDLKKARDNMSDEPENATKTADEQPAAPLETADPGPAAAATEAQPSAADETKPPTAEGGDLGAAAAQSQSQDNLGK